MKVNFWLGFFIGALSAVTFMWIWVMLWRAPEEWRVKAKRKEAGPAPEGAK
jgi:hypothetical protein